MLLLVSMYSALSQCLQLWTQLHMWITIAIIAALLHIYYPIVFVIRLYDDDDKMTWHNDTDIMTCVWHDDMTDSHDR